MNPGKTFTVNGKTYVLRKAEPPTTEQQAATLAKQAACKHLRGVHYTNPLTCMECGKVMP